MDTSLKGGDEQKLRDSFDGILQGYDKARNSHLASLQFSKPSGGQARFEIQFPQNSPVNVYGVSVLGADERFFDGLISRGARGGSLKVRQ